MTTESPLISLIIPVHNAENFLDECLRSVICQTYQNIEIIAVDDDSTDGSKKIINRYQKQDQRIKYFYVNKHNAAQTRRKGVANASADYVCFVDADDIIHEKYVEILYTAMQKTGAKIVTAKIASIKTSGDIETIPKGTSRTYIEDDLLAYFGNNYHSRESTRYIAQSINAKMLSKDLFDTIDYSVLKTSILEDNYIIAQILHNVTPHKVTLVDSVIYYYRLNQNSTMGSVLNHLIAYGNKDISYPQLFEKTMDYINSLYGKTRDVVFYTNKIKAEEYYGLSEVVVDRNMRINDTEKLLEEAREHIAVIEARQVELNKEIEDLLDSKSYKVGRIMTYPVRKFKEGRKH